MFLGLIFFLELTAGILAFVFKDWIKDQLNFFINNNVKAYRDDIDLQNLIDFAQDYVSPRPSDNPPATQQPRPNPFKLQSNGSILTLPVAHSAVLFLKTLPSLCSQCDR